jgi:hypothetical protein
MVGSPVSILIRLQNAKDCGVPAREKPKLLGSLVTTGEVGFKLERIKYEDWETGRKEYTGKVWGDSYWEMSLGVTDNSSYQLTASSHPEKRGQCCAIKQK